MVWMWMARRRCLHVGNRVIALARSLINSFIADTSIEAPPSVLPQNHYCDITGLEVIGYLQLHVYSDSLF
jgi:hypothetical protein